MYIIKQIWNFINPYLKKLTIKDWLIIILCIFCVVCFWKYRYYENKYKYDTIILNDTIVSYQNKLGEEYKAKNLYVQSIKDLKEHNQELYSEIQSLKDNPIVVIKTKTQFLKDTIYANSDSIRIDEKNDSSLYKLYWNCRDEQKYYSLNGVTTVSQNFNSFNTVITDLMINNDITLDVVENKTNLMVLAKSNNPYINVSNINSVIIEPNKSKVLKSYFKQKKWGIGIQGGIGFQYDLLHKQGGIGPYVGIGCSYNLINF